MAKKKTIEIKCSCGEEFRLPPEMKGEFTCSCGERYGVNAERGVQVIPSPYPVYPPMPRYPYRPWWPGGGTWISSGTTGPYINSGGAANQITIEADTTTVAAVSYPKL
jgi:hypothetical protein